MQLNCQFSGSSSNPFTFKHFCSTGLRTTLSSAVKTITYHVQGYVPQDANYPEQSIYVANYGTYTVENAVSVPGYKFTGWNRDSINGTNVSGDTLAPITEDIDLYGKFTMDVSVKKVWNDNNNQYGARPSSVTVTLYDGNTSTGKTLTLSSYNNWSGTFSNVDASDNYTVRENTISNYSYSVSENAEDGLTVTNTYTGPIISATKTVSPQPSVGYVLEGETLTYTITVENDGQTSKNVVIKDTVPSGTTFVSGSIKINNSTRWYTQSNLSSGITVNVPARGSATLSFSVTVNTLTSGTYSRTISNTATVDGTSTNQVQTKVNKPNVTFNKTSSPSSGSVVESGDTITYTITLNNSTGSAPATVLVKDSIPTGTTFVSGSIKVGGSSTSYTSTNLSNGISVPLNAGQTKTVEFKVTVNDLNNGATISNVATVDGEQTSTVTHTYAEAVISSTKSATTANGLSYVVEGERITYTITVRNDGDLSKNVVIKDTIPSGTSFVSGSIRVNNSTTYNTQSNLSSGITVNVPARGSATLSFAVTVNTLTSGTYSRTISNTATVDGTSTNEVTETVNKPNVQISKSSSPSSGSTVEAGDTITYTITLDNSHGTAPETVIVKDNIPTGTTFVSGSVSVGGYSTGDTASNLSQGIGVALNAGQTKTVSFRVTVNDLNNGATIENVATVGSSQTNRTTHTYVEPVISATKTLSTENGLSYVVGGERITYTITVKNDGGASKYVTVKDSIPYGLSFVTGSIKVNGYSYSSYTQSNLQNGISVYVPAYGQSTVSFDVTANELSSGTLSLTITNKATVDDEDVYAPSIKVNKPNIVVTKSSSPSSGSIVEKGDTITYTITLNNSRGTAPGTVIVRDNVPSGTTFVNGSIRVGNSSTTYTSSNLASGISVGVPAGETQTVQFSVTVNDNTDGARINNQATVDGETTNTTYNTYGEPVISSQKSFTTENGYSYVVEGEIITYTITVSNDGRIGTNVTVTDSIPSGTTFVSGSVKINGSSRTDYTQYSLSNGITVNVPAYDEATVSFQVRVNEITDGSLTKEIRNIAYVDGDPTGQTSTTVNKADVKFSKTSYPASGSNVKAGDTITYYIELDNSNGTAPANVTVRDNVPTGTTFVNGSIRVGSSSIAYTSSNLASGISVGIPAGETQTVQFSVTVNDNTNGINIENQAYINDEPTNKTEHTFVEPIISSTKSATTENNLAYVVEGEKITYTITVENNGGLAGNAIIKDTIPEGTSFVAGSIKISNNSYTSNLTQTNLQNGITVYVPAYGQATLSFEVTVNKLADGTFEGTIRNTGTVDGTPTNEVTEEVKKPDVQISKESDPASGEKVTKDDEITYRIKLDNSNGTAPGTVTVKDTIPTGTSFVSGSIKIGETSTGNTETNLARGINVTVNAGETKCVEFKVTVNDLNNGETIRNIATVEDPSGEENQTNETIHEYAEPIISSTKTTTTENSLAYAVEGEKITYTITIKNDGDLAKNVVVTDNIPDGTSFVEGSIKVNNAETEETETTLASGITVPVEERGQSTLSFEVTVDELPDGELSKEINNTATVDGTPTNETTNTVNKADVKYSKESSPASGETVENGEEITYTIKLDNSEGKAPATVVVKDTIPEGTTFVENSIKVGGSEKGDSAENLASGISVDLNAGETKTVEFKVRVNDLDNGTKIENQATVNDTPTNKTEHTYVEPIISSLKTATTENSLNYVVEGEKITYTITVKNDGDLAKNVVVKDEIPEGTSFVENSIKVNNEERTETQSNLKSGITVNVPARGETTLSFEVTVNELPTDTYTSKISNVATVDGTPTDEVEETVNKPNVEISKESEPASGERVKVGDEITYTIKLDNSKGTAPETVVVKDNIPAGTTFVEGSIKVGDSVTENTAENLSSGIGVEVLAGETKTVKFQVTVNDINNGDTIRNVATVAYPSGEENSTNETTHTYIEPIISSEKTATTEEGLGYVVEGEKITYTITITNDGDLAKNVVVTDEVPEGTSFVTGSIKVNGGATADTSDTLASGITVPVSARGESTISFDVTVNELTGGELTKEIDNTAQVDGTPTNETTNTVNKAEVKYSKESIPESGETVENGEEITYIIKLDNSEGKAPATVVVKDTIPTGTTFVDKSVKVGGAETEDTAQTLASGISVSLNAGETKTVEFKVTVNDLDNGTKIENTATVNDTPTNKTEHTYVEPIISGTKSATTENSLAYVVEGEKITYTITVRNDGGLAGNAKITDSIPAGTSFVAGSIQISNNENTENLGQVDLQDGITVNVPAYGNATLSFDVTVDELPEGTYTSTIRNTATVDGTPTEEVTDTVNKPNVQISKTAEPQSGTKVTTDDEITYCITLDNRTGTAPTTVTVKDTIPTGTSFVTGSIKVNNSATGNTEENLASGIEVHLNAGETKTLEFKVTANEQADNTEITNIATVDGKQTDPVIHTYVKPIISGTKAQQTEHGLDYVVEGEKITYTITVKNDGGYAKDVTVIDNIPEGTTLVPNSVKIDGRTITEAEGNLSTGLTVNVQPYTSKEVTFEVTVNELAGNTLTKEISNTATVDGTPTDEVTTEVRKSHVIISKSSNPVSGENVKVGDIITYTIKLDNSAGTASTTVTVKDTIPTGTSFVDGSVKVENTPTSDTADTLASGIEVNLNAGETKNVEFKVKVDDLGNGTQIKNTATVNNEPTNETTHTYVEPIISAEKKATTENNLPYVVEGEKITYTITIKNDGDLAKNVVVTDNIPEGTSFVDGSVKVNEVATADTQSSLKNGITVPVSARGESTLSFEVTVNELTDGLLTKEITNKATVDGTDTNEVKETVNKPNVQISKSSIPASGENVIAGQEITYTIKLDNSTGTAPTTVAVKDTIPQGTSFVDGSVKVGNSGTSYTADNLASGISVELGVGETKNVEFKVKVLDLSNGAQIKNIATANRTPTNETTHRYVEPIISSTKSATTENNLPYVVEGEKITYTITVKNDGDLAKNVVVTDNIPEGTSFVDGSVKVNEVATQDTASTLASGITVPVSARGQSTLSFEVTVNELTGDELTKTIRNTAQVDGTPTDEITNTVNKADVKFSKESIPASGETVENGEEITYIIKLDNSEGTAPTTVTVKDTIPTGTSFVDNSIKVGNEERTDLNADSLANGINVDLNARETKNVEFKVKVNDLDNNVKIENVATVNDTETNKTTHTYVEPIISGTKSATTENSLSYVVEGEKITYTITVRNDGGLSKDVQIQDTVPTGTSFVTGSIQISNNSNTSNLGQTDLRDGITVNVPAYEEETLSFQVTVNNLPADTYASTIRNTATVDGTPTDEIVETVNKPNVEISKSSDPANGENVKVGDEITYTITLDNRTGTAPDTVTVKDTIPAGTSFVNGSIKVGGSATQDTEDDLKNGISVNLNAGETKTVEFKVTVDDLNNGDTIRNIATVDDESTNETTHKYVEPIISGSKSSTTEKGLGYVVEGEKITYTISIKNDGDLAKNVTVTDTIPEGTSFVEGSIKINNGETEETESTLASGITVPVSERGESTLSFEVTVDNLPDGELTRTIRNTANVDGKDTDEVTNTVNKADVKFSKTSNPASGENVKVGDIITYTIELDNSEGTAPATAIVKDTIPTGTNFVEGSIKVGDEERTELNVDNLASGISVDLNAGETKNVEFKVTVQDLDNGTQIKNIATANDTPTNETTHKYVEPIISAEKTATTENGEAYVVEGEKITYTITIKNDGDLAKNVVVKDEIPEETSFVEGSIKVDEVATGDTQTNLKNGITVPVAERSQATLSFDVTVNELTNGLLTKEISNVATVDGNETNEVKETVNKPNVQISKSSNPTSGENVKAGQEITYTIKLDNSTGTAPTTVNVKDTIPQGTSFVAGSIKVGNSGTSYTSDNLASEISVDLGAGETKNVEFKVTVQDLSNGATIRNIATVDDKSTNDTTHRYVEPIISSTKSVTTENSLPYVVEGERITYTITVKNDGDLAKNVVVTDNIPDGTSFVDGSVKVNNSATQDTASTLASGITVPVAERGESTISFEVTVNELTDGSLTKVIRNTAQVDGTPTNETTNTVNKADVKYSKESIPASGETVENGEEITYIITLDNSEGTAPTTAIVKDNIPTGTSFVTGSVKVGGTGTEDTAQTLASGISVDLDAGETKTVEFKVTVNDLDNNTKIENVATVNDTETNKTTHTYVEPIISGTKSATTENSLAYVVEGEKITYTITVRNDGGLSKDVKIQDTVPTGTSLVDGSIQISNNENTSNLGQTDLRDGITVNVPAYETETLSFQVTVNNLPENTFTGTIRNTATVDGTPTEEVTDTVNKPNVQISKTASPASGTKVTTNDEITYIITLDNRTGTAPTTVTVKDTIPTGTSFVNGSIKVNDSATGNTEENLASGIEVYLNAGEIKTLEFKVTANEQADNTEIRNVATVDGKETDPVTHTYVKPIISGTKEQETENGLDYVIEGETITYTITVKNDGGYAKDVTVIDNIPEGTTLVPNSVKIDGREITELEGNLNSGLTVNVQPYTSKEVTFEVTVNELTGDTLRREISNTATVDGTPTDEVTTEVRKPHVIISKSSNPTSGENVKVGDIITYSIRLDNSTGTAPTTVTVKDTIPTGTSFVDGSVKVGNTPTSDTADTLASGIEVNLNAGETKTVEFKVTVQDLDNGTEIKNTATVNDEQTNETTHTYVEPIISSTKTVTTENSLSYVVEGEKITYTITIKNDGDLAKGVVVKDEIPEGTSFVENSIKVNNEERTETQSNLKNGITVNVPARGQTTLSFDVTVNELTDGLLTKEISNKATVDGTDTNEVKETVNKPNVQISKSASPENGNVVAGQEITYTIKLDNSTGTAPTTVNVKDTIPTGTSFVTGSIRVGKTATENTAEDLANGINVDLNAGETKNVEFKVTVNDIENGTPIRNIASVDDEPTNEIEHTYVEPIISTIKSATTENNLPYVVEGEKITYTIKITNDGDLAKNVVVTDNIPDGTSFVAGSIKVNGGATEDTSDTLASGITVPVAERGESTISFEVTVDELTDGSLTKVIRNTAGVDGTPTDEVTVTVNKSDVKFSKSSDPESGEEVKAGDTITYTIELDNSKGTAPTTVVVKDTIPDGTTFVDNSIKVGETVTGDSADNLASGISVDLDAGQTKTVEFKVIVNDLDNGAKIENTATVNDTPTNKTEHTYVEPIISSEKSATTENNLSYVVEGEKITYTITVKNDGDLSTNVIVTDEVPAGTSFVEDSIRANDAETEYTADNLTSGITVPVFERGQSTLSFEVTVDALPAETFENTIRNTALIDGTPTEEVTETVNKPNVEISKSSIPESGENVKLGDEITYIIKLDNTLGTAPSTVTVKDNIPTGTTFVNGSIKVGDSATGDTEADLASGIDVNLNPGETKTVEFKVTVNDLNNGETIRNVATVTDPSGEEKATNETEHTYVEPIISSEKASVTENGLPYVVEGEKITYTITIKNDGDLAKDVVVTDNIPEGTTFVENSIKVNNAETNNTQEELRDGITIKVPERNQATVSFEVTVDELPEGKVEKEIKNIASVDGTDTNEETEEVNKAKVRIGKTSQPASGEQVTKGEEIKYIIVMENTEGTAPITLDVKDSIPEGTTFVEGSIKVNNIDLGNTLEDLTTNGISVLVPAGQTSTVEFKVTVNDLDNGYIIRNKAKITNPKTGEEKDTNEVTHEYIEAIINASKELETENNLSYVVVGEELTYIIRVSNSGDLSKKFIIQDSIPTGTEFVEESILLNGQKSNMTKEQLEEGFEVELTGRQELTVSFKVKVVDGATEIKNTANIDGTPTNETKVPVLSYEKTAEVIRQTVENIPEGTVTTGDKIKYTIKVSNLGEETIGKITVKDFIPEGTTLSKAYNDGKLNDKNEIIWNIADLEAGTSIDLSFEVTVNYDILDNKVITNVATVDEKETNETETPYEKPEIKEESTIEKTGTEAIDSTEDSISYKITYNASINDFVGEGKVTITDYLPYEIDIENQYLDGGFYDAKTKTITWEEDVGAIDTYTNKETTINLEKNITVKYVYGEDAETLNGTIPNRVEGKIELIQKDPENPTQDKTVLEDTKEDTFETEVQIPTSIIVHYYIEGTNQKVPSKTYGQVVEDEIEEGYVGQSYTTLPSENVQENYQLVSNTGNTTGILTRTPIEVIYYYRLQPADITENTITKDGTNKIVNKDDKVSYTINYTGKVENYVGDAKVEIVDYLPYAIDESASNLNGGKYNALTKTITWVEDIGRINTYTNSNVGNINITKNIEVVFREMNYTGTSFINRAQGKIILEETNQEQETPEAEKETETEFVKNITVEKVWDDNSNIKERRPESVTVQLTADGKVMGKVKEITNEEQTNNTENTTTEETNNNIENTTTEETNSSTENATEETTGDQEYKVVLNNENNWTHTFTNLPKYTEQGQEISYSVVETETNVNDLEYYDKPVIEVFNTDTTATVRVTNSYKLMDTSLDSNIEKTGTDLVTSSTQEVNYNIKYNTTVEEYIGEALITITDYMPYAIDEEKSDLDGGTYDSVSNTITWTENIDHINTYENGDYNVNLEKNIKVVFTNLDASSRVMVNRVTGRIDLYETEKTNTVETTYETKVEIPGNVVVKYVDKSTGTEIAEGYELEGLAGDKYNTEKKDIYGYTFVESTNNTSGNMIEGTIEVIYYYERTDAGGVIVHYVDEFGNKLTEDDIITGKVSDPYKTEQKDIPNYDFVRVEGQTEGELIEGTIEVTYIYKKVPAKVIVQYLEKDDTPDDNTDNVVLALEEIIEGFSGDEYTTERKDVENYQIEIPENADGTMTREDIYVIYYYERKPSGIVTVKYVDVDTNEEILHKVEDTEEYVTYREQLQGLCGLEYEAEKKDIPYYNFVEEMRPANATGIYTEDDIEVIYYYKKQTFNLSVEKQIERITVNGVEHSLKDGLDQIDVVASKVQETDIVVTYKIIVSNPSEIEGTATAIERIPDFFRIADGTSTEWTENGKSLEAQVTLQPGETKELTVVLRWIKNTNNFGLQINTVTLQNITNPANYEETNLEDNTSTAEVIFSVKTGGIDTSIVIGTALTVMIGALILTVYLKERKTK